MVNRETQRVQYHLVHLTKSYKGFVACLASSQEHRLHTVHTKEESSSEVSLGQQGCPLNEDVGVQILPSDEHAFSGMFVHDARSGMS